MSNSKIEAARALVAQADAADRAQRRDAAQTVITAMDVLAERLGPAVAEIQASLAEALPATPPAHVTALRAYEQSLAQLLELPTSLRQHQAEILKANREPEA